MSVLTSYTSSDSCGRLATIQGDDKDSCLFKLLQSQKSNHWLQACDGRLSAMRRDRLPGLRVEISTLCPRPVPMPRVAPLPSPITPVNGIHRLPTELWWRILRLVTDIGLDNNDLPTFKLPSTEPLSVRRMKRTIVQVCSTWRDMGTPFLYEYLAPENHAQALRLHALLSHRPQLGKFTKHIAFAIHASYNDLFSHVSLAAGILLLVPSAVSVHFILMSSLTPSTSPEILGSIEASPWNWKALHWIDTTANDPRSFERMLKRCPLLEQLHFSGAAVSHQTIGPDRVCFRHLRMLAIRDAGSAALKMAAGWSMPNLTHLSLALRGRDHIEALARELFEHHGHIITFLRIDGFGMSCSVLTSFIALCPELEELICRAGLVMPDGMPKLRRVGLLRPLGTSSGAIRIEHLRTFRRLRSLQILIAMEDARFSLSCDEALGALGTNYSRIGFLDAAGQPITFTEPVS